MSEEPNYLEFKEPRLAQIYDDLNPAGDDFSFFCRLVDQLAPKKIIDFGCGTGGLAIHLASRGYEVIGIDPSQPMLDEALRKDSEQRVDWRWGSTNVLANPSADLIVLTSHVAQFFLDDEEWRTFLKTSASALSSRGHLVFDIRADNEPPFPGWPTKQHVSRDVLTKHGRVHWWHTITSRVGNRLSYDLHFRFVDSGEVITSSNSLAFRSPAQIGADLVDAGFRTVAIYGDWEARPFADADSEMIYVAQRQ